MHILLIFVFLVSSESAPIYDMQPVVYFLPAGPFFYTSLQLHPALKRANENALWIPDAAPQYLNLASTALRTEKVKDEGDQGIVYVGGSPEIEPKLTVTSLIQSIPFLPIEINVPHVISTIASTLRDIFINIGQRIPFINTYFTSPDGMMVVSNIPMTKQNSTIFIFISNPNTNSSDVSQ